MCVEKPINKSRFNKQKVQGEAESLARSRTGNNNNRKKKQQVDWLMIFNYPVDIFLRGNDEKTDKMRRVRALALSQRANKKKSFVQSKMILITSEIQNKIMDLNQNLPKT